MNKIIIIGVFILLNLVLSGAVLSWDNEVTHKDISEIAGDNSVLSKSKGDYLKGLGFDKGLMQELKWGTNNLLIKKWLAEGANLEDSPLSRSFNHFHNPLRLWYQSGLDDWIIFHLTGKSSLLWSQDGSYQQSSVNEDWSWQKTREYFHAALTSMNTSLRQENFAKTFRGLGHQMHLLQDTAVPDHVRNDAHTEDAIFGKVNINKYFESWAKSEQQRIIDLASDPNLFISPNVSFNVSYNGLAPTTQLFDAEEYNGTNPSTTLTQGLSEYTNANFFSEDTIFAAERYAVEDGHYFPYPKRSSTDLQNYLAGTKPEEIVVAEDGDTDAGIWISKTADGENVSHIVRTGNLSKWVYTLFGEGELFYKTFYRDEKCHEDYAQKLIPRAVGYSAGLLDYFFRGSIEITLPDSGIYAKIDDPAQANNGFRQIKLRAKNIAPDGEQMNNGSIELVVKYRLAQGDPFHSIPPEVGEEFYYITASEATGIRSIPNSLVELTFNLSETPIPLYATDVYLQVVYHGKLGMEDNAVAVGVKDISEPTPIDEYNNMDKTCIYGIWYDAGSQEAYDALPETALLWDYWPHDLKDDYIRVSLFDTPVEASPSEYTFYTPLIQAKTLYRVFILSDYKFSYSGYGIMEPTDARDLSDHTLAIKRVTAKGASVRNQEEYSPEESVCSEYGLAAPCTVRRTSLFYTFRGVDMWGPGGFIIDGVSYPNYTDPDYITCLWEDLVE